MDKMNRLGGATLALATLGALGEAGWHTYWGHQTYPEGLRGSLAHRMANVVEASLWNLGSSMSRREHLSAASKLPVRDYTTDEMRSIVNHIPPSEPTYLVPVDVTVTVDDFDKDSGAFTKTTLQYGMRHYPLHLFAVGTYAFNRVRQGDTDRSRTIKPCHDASAQQALMQFLFPSHVSPQTSITSREESTCHCSGTSPFGDVDPAHRHFSLHRLLQETRDEFGH